MEVGFGTPLAMSVQVWPRRILLWIGGGIAFLIQPALTLLLVFLLAWAYPAVKSGPSSVLLLGALYLALINVTKLPESDLAVYLQSFDDAKSLSLGAFLLLYAREPLYYVSLYGLASVSGLDGRTYVFLSTFIPYLVFGTAVLRMGVAMQINRRALLSLLVFLLFFGQLFSLSGHLLRQFLASSLVMLFLSAYAVAGRRRLGLGLLGMMVHYSSMPLILLSFLKAPKRYSASVTLLLQTLILMALYAIAVYVAPYFTELPVLGMVFQRLANGEGAELDPLSLSALGTAAMVLVISLFSFARTNAKELSAGDETVLLCTILVCVIVLTASTQPMLSEIATRYFLYLYFLIGLVLVILMARVPISRLAVHMLAVLSVPLFFYKLVYGEWNFAPLDSLLFDPAWMLWGYLSNTLY